MSIVDGLTLGIGIAGGSVILYGVSVALFELARNEIARLRGVNICKRREHIRHHLGSYLLLGLEFLIAADVIHTIVDPDVESLIVLGATVAIRTVISYFLNRELAGAHDCDEEQPEPAERASA